LWMCGARSKKCSSESASEKNSATYPSINYPSSPTFVGFFVSAD
ncbi:MAG: hypothetical protein ACI809_000577, partial [Candidatus Azotimanducaceae bacterium]